MDEEATKPVGRFDSQAMKLRHPVVDDQQDITVFSENLLHPFQHLEFSALCGDLDHMNLLDALEHVVKGCCSDLDYRLFLDVSQRIQGVVPGIQRHVQYRLPFSRGRRDIDASAAIL